MSQSQPVAVVGLNHVALDVGDVDAAREWYQGLFDFEIRGESDTKVFLDMGDQFLALAETAEADERNEESGHLGLVVSDIDAIESRLEELEIDVLDTPGLDVRDPWGNRLQLVAYRDVQFTKADHVLAGMGLSGLEKSDAALDELVEKGMAPPSRA